MPAGDYLTFRYEFELDGLTPCCYNENGSRMGNLGKTLLMRGLSLSELQARRRLSRWVPHRAMT